MFLIENKIELMEYEKTFIDNIVLSDNSKLPWFVSTNGSGEFAGFAHTLMIRPTGHLTKEAESDTATEGDIVSPKLYNAFDGIFRRICAQNGIEPKTVYRSCLNFTTYDLNLHGKIHRDHTFEHYIFLMYLNEFDSGCTFLFDENDNINKVIKPGKNKFAIFDGNYRHARGSCLPGQTRIVWVVTFGV